MKMKNTFLLGLLVVLCFGCQSADERIEDTKNADTTIRVDVKTKGLRSNKENSVEATVSMLNEEGFISKIFDFKTKKEWAFAGDKPAIIDFYADWCGPCKKLSPTIEKMAGKYAGKIRVYKVNIDQQQLIVATFGIQSIPTVLFCPMKGKPLVSTGYVEEAELEKYIEQILNK